MADYKIKRTQTGWGNTYRKAAGSEKPEQSTDTRTGAE